MADYVSPEARRRIAGGLMAAQYDRATPEEGNVTQRHGLLPLATYDNGRTGLAFPGFVADPLESWGRLLKNGYQGGTGDTQGVEDAFNVAGAAMLGGFAAPNLRNVVGSAGGELKGAATGAIPDTPGIRAYHGSPHDFDRFDLSKIGTGEGAQAYGHGLYFAESEGVAKWYRDNLGGKGAPTIAGMRKNYGTLTVGGKRQDAMSRNEALAASNYNIAKGDADKATSITAKDLPKLEARLAATVDADEIKSITQLLTQKQEIISHIEAMRGQPIGRAAPGRMYEVNIKANPDDFLDWDKPLSQQSEKVKTSYLDALGKLGHPNPQKVMDSSFASSGGGLENLLNAWSKYDRSKASGALNEAGIPGIRYLDQGSRGAGDGSRNLVVFDDKLIEILRKYGLLGMAGGAAAAEYGTQNPMLSRPASPQYRPGDA